MPLQITKEGCMTLGPVNNYIHFTLLITLMTGCGGGGAGVTSVQQIPVVGAPEVSRKFETQYDDFNDLEQLIARETVSGLTPATLLTNARFSGLVNYTEVDPETAGENHRLIGDVTIIVTLSESADSLTGTFENFIDQDGVTLDGTVRITNGRIERGADTRLDYSYSAQLVGELRTEDGIVRSVQGGLDGDFRGVTLNHASGNSFLVLRMENDATRHSGSFQLSR